MDELNQFLSSIGQVLSLLKKGKDLLPDGKEKEDTEQALMEAEASLKVAEAKLAQSMGFELCQCSWPPNIMLFKHQHDEYRCSACGNAITRVQLRRERDRK